MMDFTGFRFGNIHTKDLHLLVVSTSDRYDKNLLPDNNDYTMEVPGGNGSYYYGSTFSTREISVDIAFDSVDEQTWRRISNLFASDKLQDLVFDELPYKTFRAKVANKPEFKFICFMDRDKGERIYKGEGSINFICYQPFAYGFNKYIVRAADHYLDSNVFPDIPDYDDKYENPYEKKKKKIPNLKTKEYYRVENNMGIPWKGGYPTMEQVRAGELYFNAPDGTKKLIDVRRYFRNVPEWAATSKLLTTPTLDNDQELIFLPQYSKIENINMDIGLAAEQALIGSRMLVYNPGDLPVEFNLDMERVKKTLGTERGGNFQIRRYNVQRVCLPEAIDWTSLETLNKEDNKTYKYGKKYFKLLKRREEMDNNGIYQYDFEELNDQHPKHTYLVEPIPQQKLGHYIKLFYWQSQNMGGGLTIEEGERLADRYEELYGLCINDHERNELYWETLKTAIFDKYKTTENVIELFINENKNGLLEEYQSELYFYYKDKFDKEYPPEKAKRILILEGHAQTRYAVSIENGKPVFKLIQPEDYSSNPIDKYVYTVNFNGVDYKYKLFCNPGYNDTKGEYPFMYMLDEDNVYYNGQDVSSLSIRTDKDYQRCVLRPEKGFIYEASYMIPCTLSEVYLPESYDPDLSYWTQQYFIDNKVFAEFLYTSREDSTDPRIIEYINNSDKFTSIIKSYLIETYGISVGTEMYESGEYDLEEVLLDYYGLNQLFYNYIYNPPEFILKDANLNYGEEYFNNMRLPQWFTEDYFDIDVKDITLETLNLDTDKRMLYTKNRDNFKYNPLVKDKRYFDYKEKKTILNENIKQGHWFKIPPGWSLIDVVPICDEKNWGGKTWFDARPFEWGYNDSNMDILEFRRSIFNKVYDTALEDLKKDLGMEDSDDIDLIFRRDDSYTWLKDSNTFVYEYLKQQDIMREYKFLKLIHAYWRMQAGPHHIIDSATGETVYLDIKGTIDEWWWYACNYMWQNFPPVYWGYADILNKAKIDYVPLFY